MSPPTDPLTLTAVSGDRTPTAVLLVARAPTVVLPRLHALCSRTVGNSLCHLPARHDAACLPPPDRVRRPGQWPRPALTLALLNTPEDS